MKKRYLLLGVLMFLIVSQVATAFAATVSTIQKVRYSQSAERIRLVFDVNTLPEYDAAFQESPAQIQLDFSNTLSKVGAAQLKYNDTLLDSIQFRPGANNALKVLINLKATATYQVFTLSNPNRLILDIKRETQAPVNEETPAEAEPALGVKYRLLQRSGDAGPIAAHILEIDPLKGYGIKPALGNGQNMGVATLSDMTDKSRSVGGVNASYFSPEGEIYGLLKIDGTIVSVPDTVRTAAAIMPDGKVLIDQVEYNGTVTLPDSRSIAISGVNCERNEDTLIVYNKYYAGSTKTNPYGTEYRITGNKVTAISKGNSTLGGDSIVLSSHGNAEKALAGLKVGDTVKINQSMGAPWDKAAYIAGAGPMLVKDGGVYLTTKAENFGADVAGGRAPRTALGVTKDGHVLLVVVDGRQTHSVGMTLLELALFMQEIGAQDAMNFDGGGSSEMVMNGRIVNKPSDGRERRVGDALVVVPLKMMYNQGKP
ncbi:phosphodiester glycosidase family protein [Azotosporobacter soli]|uniref:phosphodiester glycosidase family protein n=1 Tax=Azotosporobacter soli TaxID=3055040 RepID=UPI0031FEF03B